MQIGIIHLTDLHLEKDKNNLSDKINSLCSVVNNEFSVIENRYLIISGDIVNHGKAVQYISAKEIIQNIMNENNIKKIVIVPGNHDCNFDLDTQIRRNSINNVDYNTLGDDGSVIEQSINVQKDFWEFYSEFNELPNNKLAYQITDKINEKKISFKCFNTSWMSSIDEKVGVLFFPVNTIENIENESSISISVFHHPINWFSPNKATNNRNEFQDYLDSISNIKLIGHEHENRSISTTNLNTNISVLEFSGEIFNNNNNIADSGFQIMKINLANNDLILKKYFWENDIYREKYEKTIPLKMVSKRKLKIIDNFWNELDDIKIPLQIEGKPISLSKIYVYPDLEEKKEDYKKLDSYIDSKQIVNENKFNKLIIDGESQIGKTSLLSILFKDFYNFNFYPFLLNGDDINKNEVDKIIKKKFNKIYSDNSQFDRYLQINKKKKVLLIDDFYKNKLPIKKLKQFIEEISNKFMKVIIVTDASVEFSADAQSVFNEYIKVTIKPLGYQKTDDLITNYFECKSDFLTLGEQEKLLKIKNMFNQVRNLLGDKILPSYPVFILSLLRTLDEASYSLNETSYGYCYESLLYFALKSKAKLKENQLTYYLSFIEQLAFKLFTEKKMIFDKNYLQIFYDKYKQIHFIDDFNTLEKNLIDSYILKSYDNTYNFGYKYIYYFLIAKHIAGIVNTKDGKIIIKELFDRLYLEENANILVFITHHTKDNNFIEESVLKAMEPFENIKPISLKKDCNYYSLISGLSENVKNEILETNISPNKRRKENLKRIDENKNNSIDSNFVENDDFRPYMTAFKAIDIVSQIIKNRVGYLTKDEMSTYIKELYLTGFRMIGAIGETYKDAKDKIVKELVNSILDDIEGKSKNKKYLLEKPVDRTVIEKKVNSFFEIINLQICLSIFSKLVESSGISDNKIKEIYSMVADEIDTPAAQLVTFSIKSYYYGVSFQEIKELAQKFEKNPVALKILKARVISYAYNNHLDYRKKQQISKILKLQLKPTPKRLK